MAEQEARHVWHDDAEILGIYVIGVIAINPIFEAFGSQSSNPLFIYEESAEPTNEELVLISNAAEQMGYEGKAGHLLKKLGDNLWTYRRLSWTQGPLWFPKPAPLNEILEKI